MRAPWRKTNPVGPETGFIVADPEGRPRAQRDGEIIQRLKLDVAELAAALQTAEADAAYWRSMYYSILTIREAFEHAVEATGWVEVSTQEKVGVIKPIATQEYPPNEGRPIPNTPDYLGEYPPLADVQSTLRSYHEGTGL